MMYFEKLSNADLLYAVREDAVSRAKNEGKEVGYIDLLPDKSVQEMEIFK